MRVLIPISLAAMTLLLAGWTQSSESHMPWNPKGKAVVKTPDGVSHVIRQSVCNFGPHAGRLRFGGTAVDSDAPYISLVVRELKGKPTVLDIEDGIVRLAPNSTFAVLGSASVQERPVKRGTFVLFKHKGSGVTGNARYTGSWKCG